MITFPNAKINIGLNVVEKRPDGYHNLETVFFPVPVVDALEIVEAEKTEISFSGRVIDAEPKENLVYKAYCLLKEEFGLPEVKIHLHKNIPFGAGLGGGSADAAFTLRMLNNQFGLNLSVEQLEGFAVRLGADCPFFIRNKPVFATGIGNQFEPIALDLTSYEIVVVMPPCSVSTAIAYRKIVPAPSRFDLREIVNIAVSDWKEVVTNDFEKGVVELYPVIADVKAALYRAGALYSSMSGSGAAVFGIFDQLPENIADFLPPGAFICR